MKIAEFEDLCLREWGEARGEIISLSMTDESLEELRGEVGPGVIGLLNPITHSLVKLSGGAGTDTAEVQRHYARPLVESNGFSVLRGRLAGEIRIT